LNPLPPQPTLEGQRTLVTKQDDVLGVGDKPLPPTATKTTVFVLDSAPPPKPIPLVAGQSKIAFPHIAACGGGGGDTGGGEDGGEDGYGGSGGEDANNNERKDALEETAEDDRKPAAVDQVEISSPARKRKWVGVQMDEEEFDEAAEDSGENQPTRKRRRRAPVFGTRKKLQKPPLPLPLPVTSQRATANQHFPVTEPHQIFGGTKLANHNFATAQSCLQLRCNPFLHSFWYYFSVGASMSSQQLLLLYSSCWCV
jgi:hypothetical protein